jgi:hypothetical protein
VSHFTGRGLFFLFAFSTLKRKLAALLQDTATAKQNKPLPLNTQNKTLSVGPLPFLGCEVSCKGWKEHFVLLVQRCSVLGWVAPVLGWVLENPR